MPGKGMLAKVVAGPGHLFMCAEWTPSIGMPRFDADGEVRRVLMDQTDLFPSTTKKNEKENKTWPSRGYARPPLGTRASTRSLFFPSSPPQPLYRAPPLPNPTSHAASAAVAPPPFARSICPASHAPQKPAEPLPAATTQAETMVSSLHVGALSYTTSPPHRPERRSPPSSPHHRCPPPLHRVAAPLAQIDATHQAPPDQPLLTSSIHRLLSGLPPKRPHSPFVRASFVESTATKTLPV
jgi:hypothetical protein